MPHLAAQTANLKNHTALTEASSDAGRVFWGIVAQGIRGIRGKHKFSDIPQIVGFAPSALYLLSAPSTPDAAREEADKVESSRRRENLS